MADSTMAYILPDTGKEVDFDSVLSESHTGTSTVTDHPVERGVKVSDHVRKEPVEVSLTVLVSNTPNGPVAPYGGDPQQVLLQLPPKKPKSPIAQEVDNLFASLEDALGLYNPPAPPIASLGVFFTPFDKIADTHVRLLTIKDLGETVTVVTSTINYSDMILTSVGMAKDEKGSATFTLAFKQLFQADSKTVSAPKPLEPRGASKQSSGSQGGKDADKDAKKQSLASKALGAAKGALGL